MTLYATLDYTKSILETSQPTGATLTLNDQRLAGYLRQISERMDSEFPQVPRWTYFAPWKGQRKFTIARPSTHVNSRLNTFEFRQNLLQIDPTITLGDTVLTVGTDVDIYPDALQPPFHMLRLLGCCNTWYSSCWQPTCCAPLQVTIGGWWGYHRDWANAFPNITTLAATMTATQTTIQVADLNAPDPYGITQGLSYGSLFRIDDDTDELMEVQNVNPNTNIATVRRGVNGTTASAHNTVGDAVQVFQVELPVQEAVARQAAMQYARQGKFTSVEVQGMSEIRFPKDWLAEVWAMMQGYSTGY